MELSAVQLDKAAILLLNLENESPGLARTVLSGIDEEQAKSILMAMSHLGKINAERRQQVLSEFHDIALDKQAVYGGSEVTERIVEAVFGEGRARSFLKSKKERFKFLDSVSTEDMAQFLLTETTQTKTFLFQYLSPKRASELLLLLGNDPVAYTLTTPIDVPNPDLLSDLEVEWSQFFERLSGERTLSDEASVRKLASTMEYMPHAQREQLLKGYRTRAPKLAQRLRQLMFTFEDLMMLPEDTIKTILFEVSDCNKLALARLQLQPDWEHKFYQCLTERTQIMVDFEGIGLERKTTNDKIEEAKQYIVGIARTLEQKGAVSLRL